MADTEPMNVLMEFLNGTRAQYQIQIPETNNQDLQDWFDEHCWVAARAFTYNMEGTLCVDDSVSFVNLDNVVSIREFDD